MDYRMTRLVDWLQEELTERPTLKPAPRSAQVSPESDSEISRKAVFQRSISEVSSSDQYTTNGDNGSLRVVMRRRNVSGGVAGERWRFPIIYTCIIPANKLLFFTLVLEIGLLKRCKTANLSRVSRRAQAPVLRRDSASPSYIVCVTEFQV